jgi:thiamine biosynthesis lipoprotein
MVVRCRPLLGTFVEIVADMPEAIDLAFAAVAHVHGLMSAHLVDSELSQINRFAHLRPVPVTAWTQAVLTRALHWSGFSGGSFDCVRAGAAALTSGRLPRHPDQPVPSARGWQAIHIADQTIRLDEPACLDLGGIAKGFAVDMAIEAIQAAGASRGLVNAGGDLRGFGPDPWPVSVVDPRTRQPLVGVELTNAAMATSAGLPGASGRLSFDHLADTSDRWISVTVKAPTAMDADALTKIVWAGGVVSGVLHSVSAQAFAIRADGRVEPVGAMARAA